VAHVISAGCVYLELADFKVNIAVAHPVDDLEYFPNVVIRQF
jgi:hypothetical protein